MGILDSLKKISTRETPQSEPLLGSKQVPNSAGGKGHGTHTWAVFWKQDLIDLLARSGG